VRLGGYDGGGDGQTDESENDENFMHWGILLCGSFLELVHKLIIGPCRENLNPTKNVFVTKTVLPMGPP